MRKTLLLLLFAASAWAASTVTETQIPTQAVPNDAGQGISIAQVSGWWGRVCAIQPLDGGNIVLDAVGAMEVYDYDPTSARWERAKSIESAFTITASGGSAVCQSFEDIPVAVAAPGRRVYLRSVGLTFDGGWSLPDAGNRVNVYLTTCPRGTTGC